MGCLKLNKILNDAEISVLITNDDYIHELNLKTRKKDKPTNVLSFPYMDFKKGILTPPTNPPRLRGEKKRGADLILGDIVFGTETCIKEAKEQDKEIIAHLTHLFVHSLLHLLGFDHMKEKEAREMEALEVKILKKLNIPDPY